MRVLILGARAPACLEWVRVFSRVGWQVYAGDSLRFPITRFSRHTGKYFYLPSPAQSYQHWLTRLQEIITTEKIDLLLPTCEEVFYLSFAQESLPCQVVTPNFALIKQLHHKGDFAQLSRNWSIQAPESYLLTSPSDLNTYQHHSKEWVFKPVYSRFASYTILSPSTKRLRSILPTPDQPWLAQRRIVGNEYCSYSLFHHGKLTASICYQPRYRAGAGAGIYFSPVHFSPINHFLQGFGEETGYHGQVAFDFMVEGERFFVIECNPRATSGIHLLADQPEHLIKALFGESLSLSTLPAAAKQVSSAMCLFALPKHAFQRQFWRDYHQAQDVIQATDDHYLGGAQLLSLLEMSGRALKAKSSLLATTTLDIEWNGNAII